MPKKKSEKENEDAIFRVKAFYRKKCDVNNVPLNRTFKDKLENVAESG